jgi:ankyrin repeat protein
MKSIRLVYMSLFLMVAILGCERKESDSEGIRIKPSKVRGEALGRTLLHLAPNWKVAERLINEGAEVDAKDSFGMTPLHTAVIANRRDVAEVLVARGAEINAESRRGQTPLFWAVTKNHKDMAEWLIARGADVNAKDNYGITPLHSAAHAGSANLV